MFLDAASDLMEQLHDALSREWQIANSELSSDHPDEGVIKMELYWHKIPLWDFSAAEELPPPDKDVQMKLFSQIKVKRRGGKNCT